MALVLAVRGVGELLLERVVRVAGLTLRELLAALRVQAAAQRTQLVLRVPTGPTGVALDDGRALPDLPAGVAHALAQPRRGGVRPVAGALVVRTPTDWVVQGSESVKFTVRKIKRTGGE